MNNPRLFRLPMFLLYLLLLLLPVLVEAQVSAPPRVIVQDEGVVQGFTRNVNFGGGLVATVTAGVATVTTGGPYLPTTFTSNGVLYGATTGSILATTQGGANSVLTANAGAPLFSATPTLNGLIIGQAFAGYLVDITSNSLPTGLSGTLASASVNAFTQTFFKARGTVASPTTILTGDELGVLYFSGQNSTTNSDAGAAIKAISSGTIANLRTPGYLSFWTATNTGPSVLTERMRILSDGNVGIGVTAPTAVLHLKAGTATAGTGPLKFASGTLLGTPVAGNVEFLTDAWYGTITTGAVRKTFAFLESPTFTTPALGDASATSLTLTNDLTVPNGGTGVSTFTANGVVYGNTAGVLLVTAQGAANSILTANAGAPSFSATPTIGTSLTVPLLLGGAAANDDITIRGTSNATKTTSYVLLQDTGGFVGIGTATPNNTIQVANYINFNPTDNNALLGFNAGGNLVAGAVQNTFIGYETGLAHATLSTSSIQNNAAIGWKSLWSNRSGSYNMSVGSQSLYSNQTGIGNVAVGFQGLFSGVSASNSIGIGYQALYYATGGSHVAIGYRAGQLATGAAANTTSTTSVYIGYDAFAFANGDTNEIVIGHTAFGGGSNTATFGNTSISTTFLRGNVGIGQTTVAGITSRLMLPAGTATAGTAPLGFTSGTLLTAPVVGKFEFLTDNPTFTITTGAARKNFVLDDGTLFTPGRVPFATTNGRLTDDADLTFATDTLSATKFTATGVITGVNIVLSGPLDLIATGAAPKVGSVTLGVGGTATVNTTAATATCHVFFQRKTNGGTIGFATTYTVNANTSFTVSSDNALDTSTYSWWIVETH